MRYCALYNNKLSKAILISIKKIMIQSTVSLVIQVLAMRKVKHPQFHIPWQTGSGRNYQVLRRSAISIYCLIRLTFLNQTILSKKLSKIELHSYNLIYLRFSHSIGQRVGSIILTRMGHIFQKKQLASSLVLTYHLRRC